MRNSLDPIHLILSNEKSGPVATIIRNGLRVAEIFYSLIISGRNSLYQRNILKSHRLARSVISVGNITTGGTGKTPVVRWLADNLRDHRPAVLLRGYKSANEVSDEQLLLQEQLPGMPVIARPSRIRGAGAALAQQADTEVFILDDGMQHRKVARDFELVLIDATNPFGFDHVLPRGLLREPLCGLARANAFLITRSDLVTTEELDSIQDRLRRYNSTARIFRAKHVISGFRSGDERVAPAALRGKRIFLFCGVGNPHSVQAQLSSLGLDIVGTDFFPDHYDYSVTELDSLSRENADAFITTEKDWIKINRLNHAISQRTCVTELSLSFYEQDEQALLKLVRLSISRPSR